MKSTILLAACLLLVGSTLAQHQILDQLSYERIVDIFQTRVYDRYRDCIIEDIRCEKGSREYNVKCKFFICFG